MSLAESEALAPGGATGDASTYLAAHDGAADWEAIERLARWCEQFSPLVGFEHLPGSSHHGATAGREAPPAPDCLYLDVTGVAVHFGGESLLVRRVAQALDQLGYSVRVALADTLGAAWALAHFPHRELGWQDVGCNEAGGAERPRGSSFLVVPPGGTLAALGPLPVRALRLPTRTVACLEQLGVNQIGQLMTLPRASLLSRFGDLLLRRLDQATGRAPEILRVADPVPIFAAQWSVDDPTSQRSVLGAIARQLLERVSGSLAVRGEGILELVCRLWCVRPPVLGAEGPGDAEGVGQPVVIRQHLFQATAAVQHLTELLLLRLERERLPGAVERIAVEASITAPLERRQRELFADGSRDARGLWARCVDRLSSRLGLGQVVRPCLERDAQPERAYRYVPATSGQVGNGSAPRRDVSGRRVPFPFRPIHLYRSPRALQVETHGVQGGPRWIDDHHRRYVIARSWGPERIETGWWRGRSVRRDYYRVETRCGHWLWIFRQCVDGQWFLHGMFG